MEKKDPRYQAYLHILQEELIPALGCTEPIALAYAAAAARKALGQLPRRIHAGVSGSILKEFEMCPWDYSGAAFQYRGIIRLDYAPLWFAAGLIFEKILTKAS